MKKWSLMGLSSLIYIHSITSKWVSNLFSQQKLGERGLVLVSLAPWLCSVCGCITINHRFGLNSQERGGTSLPQPPFTRKEMRNRIISPCYQRTPIFSFWFARSSTLSKICRAGFFFKKPLFFLDFLYRDWRFHSLAFYSNFFTLE